MPEEEMSLADEAKFMKEAILDGMSDAELAERSIRGREDLKGVDSRLSKMIGEKVIKILEEIGLVDLQRCGIPAVNIDIHGRVSVSGKLGKFFDDRESLPIVELKSALGISSVNFETGVNSFLVEFSLTDYRNSRREQEGIKSPEIQMLEDGVRSGTEGVVG